MSEFNYAVCPGITSWECIRCHKINAPWRGQCDCPPPTVLLPEEWECPNCHGRFKIGVWHICGGSTGYGYYSGTLLSLHTTNEGDSK